MAIGWEIVCADVLDWAREYDGPPFHALLCDPPYHLTGGFMGRYWDKDGPDAIAFQPSTWAALAEHLHPGGFIFAFASTRGWHRLACALEDAGMIIQPSVFVWGLGWVDVPPLYGWLTGQSFPKASRIDTKIDKRKGFKPGFAVEITQYLNKARKEKGITIDAVCAEFGMATMAGHWFAISEAGQPAIPRLEYWPKLKELLDLDNSFDKAIEAHEREVIDRHPNPASEIYQGGQLDKNIDITAPATDLARAWEGHRYGGQILKDALAPIVVAQKPWTNPRLDCIVETGAGALNVDGGRIGYQDDADKDDATPQGKCTARSGRLAGKMQGGGERSEFERPEQKGRWPSNFALCHVAPHLCPDCEGAGCESCHGEGVVGGCRRAGVKRVKPAGGDIAIESKGAGPRENEIYGKDDRPRGEWIAYKDADGLETVDAWDCAEGCVAAKLGEQSGKSGSNARENKSNASGQTDSISYSGELGAVKRSGYTDDKGTAARFYQQCGWEHERAEMQCCDECPVARLDEQAGESKSIGGRIGNKDGGIAVPGGKYKKGDPGYGDEGGRSRYFYQANWSHEIAERLATSDPVHYCPKAAKRERTEGLDAFFWRKDKASPTGFVRIGREEWEALGKEEEHIKEETGKRVSLRAQGNIHPTQKPISLNKWLATLLLPPKEYAPRRILVPFAGKMSEAVGALLAGWEEIVAIELYQDYCDAGEARMEFWATRQLEMPL